MLAFADGFSADTQGTAVSIQEHALACWVSTSKDTLIDVIHNATYETVGQVFGGPKYICGFTSMSKSVEPQKVMEMLNALFSKVDKLTDEYMVHK
eukprot:scaffold142240_cov24-Tisochrysis_lutea.AAC.1